MECKYADPLVLLFLVIVGLFVACSGGGGGEPAPGGTTPPGTPVQPPGDSSTADTLAPAFTVHVVDQVNGMVTLNITGLSTCSGQAQTAVIADYEPEHFFVYEGDSEVPAKIVEADPISKTDPADADVVFVIGTTTSMGIGLRSVALSVFGFLDHLEDSGLNVRVGVITFGDTFDTKDPYAPLSGVSFMNAIAPGFDLEERASFALSSDFTEFRTYLAGSTTDAELRAGDNPHGGQMFGNGRGGGQQGWQENSLGALEYAYTAQGMGWQDGAQKVIILITDKCSDNEVAYADKFGNTAGAEVWAPSSAADVIAKLRGDAIVHVVAPSMADLLQYSACPTGTTHMADLAGPEGLGGVFVEWNHSSEQFTRDREMFDLTDLPITDAITSGYLVSYEGTVNGAEKEITLVINDEANHRGQAQRHVTY